MIGSILAFLTFVLPLANPRPQMPAFTLQPAAPVDSAPAIMLPGYFPVQPVQNKVRDEPESQVDFQPLPQPAHKRKKVIDWSNPGSIDPRQEGILDFLTADLRSWSRMASEAFASGQYRDAARYCLCILRHKYDDAPTLYNLSCCYARMGDAARAAQALWLAAQAGFADSVLLRSDADFATVRQEQVFANTRARILALLESRGKLFYVQVPVLLKCQLHLPSDFDAAKKYPLLIGLHGRGGNSDNLSIRWAELGNPQVIFVSADAPYSFPPGLFGKGAQYTWSPEHLGSADWQRADSLVVEAVRQIALNVANAYPVKATYVLGFSQGAAYAYLSAILHPEMFRGVLAFSGLFPAEQFSAEQLNKAAAQCRIFIAHGQGDMTVPIAQSRHASTRLTASGFSVTSKEFSGGHTLPLDVLREAVAWLLKAEGGSASLAQTARKKKQDGGIQ